MRLASTPSKCLKKEGGRVGREGREGVSGQRG